MADQEEQARKMLEEQAKKMGSVVAKCWSDEGFKKKLLADPAATLKAEGVKFELPAGMTLKAVENTDKVHHIVLPPKPTELSDEQLEVAAGGASACWQQCGFCQGTVINPPPPFSVDNCGCIILMTIR
jgi:hypothetical protein